jgi:pimeloyl-ACP methyl ester carboxylesterase
MIKYDTEVRSTVLRFTNAAGQRILAVAGERPDGSPRGTVVLVPGYQQRIHHLALLSRSLVRRGYRTVRFDLTDHVGASDGNVADLTMSSMAEDARAVLAACADSSPAPLHVVATSLGARAAVRALATMSDAGDDSVSAAVLVLPVVDVEATINAAADSDFFDEWRSGRQTDPAATERVIDHQVRYEFARDAIASGFLGVDATAEEISRISAAVRAIAAERDDWVDPAAVEDAMSRTARGERSTLILSATSHDLANNPPVMRLLLEQIVAALSPGRDDEVPHLSFEELLDTINQERAWAREEYAGLAGHGHGL